MSEAVTESIDMRGAREAAPRRSRRGGALAAVAIAVPLVYALVVAAVTGNLLIPHNDAWAYSKIAAGFADDLSFRLVGWNRSGLVGQTVLAAPVTWLLGDAVLAQQLLVWLLAALFVVSAAVYFRPSLGPTRSALVAASVVVFPGFGLLATSFMADVPAAALGMCCLLLGAWAAEAPRPAQRVGWLAASLVVGWLASTSREQALAAPVAVLLWFGFRAVRTRNRTDLLAGGLLGLGYLVAFGGTEFWRQTLPGNDPPTDGSAINGAIRLLASLPAAGLVLLPVAVLLVAAAPGGGRGRVAAVVGGITGLFAAGLAVALALETPDRPDALLPGNFVSEDGPYLTVGVGPITPILPTPVLLVLEVLGAAALAVLVTRLLAITRTAVRRPPAGRWALLDGRQGLAVVFLLLSLAGLGLQTLTGQQVFERYALPWVPVIVGLLLAGSVEPTRRALTAFVVTATGLALLGGVLVAGAAAHDAARWEAGEQLTARGIPATDVNAGFEWTGWHAAGRLERREDDESALVPWAFPGSRNCWVVASGPLDRPGLQLVERLPYERLLVAWPADLLVYRQDVCGPTS